MSGVLQQYNRELKEKAKEEEEKKKIMKLKARKEDLDRREKALIQEIKSGEFFRATAVPCSSLQKQELTSTDAENLFNLSKYKQKLESLALMNGITTWKQENGHIHFTLDPYIRGQPKGAFLVRMKPNQGKMILLGHNLPHAVPVSKLYGKYTEASTKSLGNFLDSLFRYLRGFLSRVDQVEEMQECMGTSIESIQATNHYTSVVIGISLKQSDVDADALRVTLSMKYEKLGERPILGSLKVATNADVDISELLEQCTPFYTSRLKTALAEAF
jgi:hypothetical protein